MHKQKFKIFWDLWGGYGLSGEYGLYGGYGGYRLYGGYGLDGEGEGVHGWLAPYNLIK